MYNQHNKYYSSVSFVMILLNIKILTGFPLEVPLSPFAPQPLPAANASDPLIETRSLNLNDTSPHLRASPLNINAHPSANIEQTPVAANPAPLVPQLVQPAADIAPRSEPANLPSDFPAERSLFAVNPPNIRIPVPNNDEISLRSGLSDLSSNTGSPIELRSLNTNTNNSSLEISSNVPANRHETNINSPPVSINSSSITNGQNHHHHHVQTHFIPSFLRSLNSGEKTSGEVSEVLAPAPDVSLRSGFEQPVVNNGDSAVAPSPELAIRSGLEQTEQLRGAMDVAVQPELGASLHAIPQDENLNGDSRFASNYRVNTHLNVFPLGSYQY